MSKKISNQKFWLRVQKSRKFKKYWHTPAYKKTKMTMDWL
jgi:hypothetical protein